MMQAIEPSRPLLIAGAGIAGLACAIAIRRAGFPVIVFEGRDGRDEDGAGIQIGPNGTAVLERLGLMERLGDVAIAPTGIDVCAAGRADPLTRLPLGEWIARRHGHPYWVLRRGDLHAALREAAARLGADIRYRQDVAGLVDTGRNVVVTIRSGAGGRDTEIEGAGLIGADGIWSGVRRIAFGSPPPRPTGAIAVRTIVAGDATATDTAHVRLWLGRDAHAVSYPIGRRRDTNLVLIGNARGDIAEQRWSAPIAHADVLAMLGELAPSLRPLLHGDGVYRCWPLLHVPAIASYASGHVCVVGDAAHPTLPFLAQGAVMALEDAEVLAFALASAPASVQDAFALFSRMRVARTQRIVAAAQSNGRLYHASGLVQVARNAAMRVIPGHLLMSQYDWLYGATAPRILAGS